MKVEINGSTHRALPFKKETYRSGHNGAHSKCVCPPGHEGSNPSVSAGFRRFGGGLFFVSSTKNSTKSNHTYIQSVFNYLIAKNVEFYIFCD